jgi:hypothetical protein
MRQMLAAMPAAEVFSSYLAWCGVSDTSTQESEYDHVGDVSSSQVWTYYLVD